MPSCKKAIKDIRHTPADKIRKHCDSISGLLYRLEIIDIIGRESLYVELRNYWLELQAIENRRERDRLSGRQ